MIMKAILKSILTVALFLAMTNLVLATQPTIHVVGDNTFILSINKVTADLKITFKDKYGYKFYKQNVKASDENFMKKFSVESLPAGVYTLEIEDPMQVINLSVKIEDNKIVREEIANEKVFKPVVYKKGENVYVSKFSPDKQPLEVTIYNSDNEIVYEEKLADKVDLGRVYTFSNSGNYTIALTSNDKTYKHTVSINK